MFHVRFAAVLPLVFSATLAAALPDESEFREIDNIPQPVPFGTGVVGCATPDGRYLLWNGNVVALQRSVGSGVFDTVGTGYVGDPGFATLSPGQDYVLLGQGFGNGTTANLYQFDFENPADFQSGDEIVVPSHFAGVFLNADLVALDRGDFGQPAEIEVIDLSTLTRSGARRSVTVLRRPEPVEPRDTIITKPSGSFSASVAVVGSTFWVADSGNGQYKSFPVADIVNAFDTSGTVAWSAGTDLGTPFQYPLGGVSGATSTGDLVMAGFGSIAVVDAGTGTIESTYDPAGSGPFYGIVYNDVTEDFIAIEFPPTFGDPLTYYASFAGIASLPAASHEWMLAVLGSLLVITAVSLAFDRRTRA